MVALRAAGGTISILVAAVLLRLTVTGTYQRYVREGMGPWLTLAAIVVFVLGLVTLLQALRRVPPADAHGHHEHGEGVGVGWLLLAPIAALLLVAPPTLGSYGVKRAASVAVRPGAAVFDPLPRTRDPAPMTILEFDRRAFDHDGSSFRGRLVQLTGFVADVERGGFRLARYQIACCAADATPVVAGVVGVAGQTPSRDQWVVVTGTFDSIGEDDIPALRASSVVQIQAPDDPYE